MKYLILLMFPLLVFSQELDFEILPVEEEASCTCPVQASPTE